MRKVAIIKVRDVSDYESSQLIASSISDWDEVTDEQFDALSKELVYGEYRVIERLTDTAEFIENTVKAHLKRIEKQKKEAEKWQRDREQKANERKQKREAKRVEKEREEYEKLKQKFESEKAPKAIRNATSHDRAINGF